MSNEIPVKQVDPSSEPSGKNQKIETVDLYASRKKIYAKEVTGLFQRIRTVSLLLLMGMYFLFVWLTLDGDPLIHFDLPAREFHLYGATFYPKDFFRHVNNQRLRPVFCHHPVWSRLVRLHLPSNGVDVHLYVG